MELPDRDKLEEQFARRMGKLSARHRRELLELLGNPPDTSRVTQEFWDRVDREEREELLPLLLLIFLASGETHARDAAGADWSSMSGQVLDTLNTSGRAWAEQQADQIAVGVTENSRNMLQEADARWAARARSAAESVRDEMVNSTESVFTHQEIERAVEEALRSSITEEDAVDVANRIFGPNRVENISITETTGAISAGGDAGIEETVGTSPNDLWITERDSKVCPICSKLHMKPRHEWEDYFWSGPPAHSRCRCYIRYVNAVVPGPLVAH